MPHQSAIATKAKISSMIRRANAKIPTFPKWTYLASSWPFIAEGKTLLVQYYATD
jgi:hypothetical protein